MNANTPVIVVDDERDVRESTRQTLELAGYHVTAYERARAALAELGKDWPGVVVSDVKMPGMDGLEFLRRCIEVDCDLPVVLVTGHGDITMAVQAMREGAYDFIEKPFRSEAFVDVVRRAAEKRALVLENRSLRTELESQAGAQATIIGRSSAIRRVHELIDNLADTDVDVLIVGETGTGKELVARCLHQQGHRRDRPFVAINCGAIPESVFESEVFGHEPGAFTGANTRRIGKLEFADGGTIFLDEIESMPMSLQVKVLRVLQERVVERLGSNVGVPIDIRVVAATKIDLKAASERGEFRGDLYYRLDVARIDLPPLRERIEDIPMLFQHFLLKACARYRRELPAVTPEVARQLSGQRWPGNVRELQNAAQRYVLQSNLGDTEFDRSAAGSASTLPEQVDAFERSVITRALADQGGNVKATHTALGIPRKTLYEKMRKHGIDRHHYTDSDDG